MYDEAETVYYTIKEEDLPPSLRKAGRQQESPQPGVETSGPPPQPPPVLQSGSYGRDRDDKGASGKLQEEKEASPHTKEEAEAVNRYAAADVTYPGGASGRRVLCSFIRSHRNCMAAGIAVLLAVGLVPLTFINKEEISQLSTTVDALKRDQYEMRQLSTAVDTLKDDLDKERNRTAALEQCLCDQDDMRQLSTTADDLKGDLDKERNRTDALEQRLHEINKMLPSCPQAYTMWRKTCYKAFDIKKNFSDAAAACHEDGGTLAMPRDAETNALVTSLYKPLHGGSFLWFGLHDQREEGSFEWVDGSELGAYNNWAPGEPGDFRGKADCAAYSFVSSRKDKTYLGDRRNCHNRATRLSTIRSKTNQ
ncbi:CD209 antigen-like [Branchiostoma lanceolatum]|uniref:CD209 antigen-like n=1 Tax=Branchiostoma lanceolatum TaxID=7740 RepID=UPI0034540E77